MNVENVIFLYEFRTLNELSNRRTMNELDLYKYLIFCTTLYYFDILVIHIKILSSHFKITLYFGILTFYFASVSVGRE